MSPTPKAHVKQRRVPRYDGVKEGASSPGAELEKLRRQRIEDELEVRDRILDAMLVVCGEVGYRRVRVEDVYRRYGGYRTQFYRHFRNKGDCFRAAYERESECLSERLIYAKGGCDRSGLQRSLQELADFVNEDPVRAKALFVEVHIADGVVRGKREEVFERLSHALDSACRENGSRHSAPPITGEFMINVVDQALSSALRRNQPEEFADAVPELAALIHRAYHGDDD